MGTLSVVTISCNEERNIADCLGSVRWADELIVVDSGSTDRTVALARKFTRKIYSREWKGYGAARNYALSKASGDWVLWLDADERVTPELAEEIRDIVKNDSREFAGYAIARKAYFLGRWIRHCGWYPSRVIRLFLRNRARFSETRVHEQLLIDGPTADSRHDLVHYTDPDLNHYLSKFNRYTTLAAEDMHAGGRSASLFDLLVRPPFLFFKMYILRLGMLDGIEGLILCILSSAYVFSKYAKLWELRNGQENGRN